MTRKTEREPARPARLPPGQSLTEKFPVLDLGARPVIRLEDFRLAIYGAVENPVTLSWDDITALPSVEMCLDFHCVTRWSRFDLRWTGIPFEALLDLAKPSLSARFVLQHGRDGYTTNVPLEEMRKPNVLIATRLEGEPIPLDHGGLVRPILPHLYAYKGSKYLSALEFLSEDRPGYWESRGYHNHGDPWREERFE